MNNNLLILGAGQYGMVVKETADATGFFDKIDFLDDANPLAVGTTGQYAEFADEYKYAFVAIGNSCVRAELVNKLEVAGFELAVIVSPYAYVSPSAMIGGGSIVEAMAVVNTGAMLGKGCLVCAGAVVNHNAVVGDWCQIDCNATVTARSEVTDNVKIECGKII